VTAWADLFGDGLVVLDGGLSTQLEEGGQDVSGVLWTGRLLIDDPGAVRDAHQAFVAAGADVVITASYQVSRRGFESAGLGSDVADAVLRSSTAVARSAAAHSAARVAASVGPYGAILHDGSEYRGNYNIAHADLVAFHRERLDVIAETAPDLLAVETIPDVREAQALVEVLADHPDLPAWLTFSARDEAHVSAGQSIEDAVAVAVSAPSVMAVGVNCTDPRHVTALVERIRAVTALPIVVYPNAGGQWDAADGGWHDAGAAVFPDALVEQWRAVGVRAVGGCCGTDARTVSAIARLRDRPAG
jgi:homocysteine S-methyltransferase